jgi:hypothetical protein
MVTVPPILAKEKRSATLTLGSVECQERRLRCREIATISTRNEVVDEPILEGKCRSSQPKHMKLERGSPPKGSHAGMVVTIIAK